MSADQIPLFSLLAQKMSWLSARQSVLAQNVANANTPGYSGRDIKALDFEQLVQGSSNTASTLNTTNAFHFGTKPTESMSFEPIDAIGEDGSANGSGVSLEKEVMKLSDTEIQYQAATNIYRKAVNMFHLALGNHS